jgi:hypothetical protein
MYAFLVLILASTEVIPHKLTNAVLAIFCSLASIGLAIQTFLIEQGAAL